MVCLVIGSPFIECESIIQEVSAFVKEIISSYGEKVSLDIKYAILYAYPMKKEITILIKHYGSKKAVADALGITTRHLENCLKGNYIGKPLEKLIRSYSVQFGK